MAIMRHIIELLVNPFLLCLLFLGLSTVFLWRKSHLVFVRITLCVVTLTLIIISTGWLPMYLTHRLEARYDIVNQVDPDIQWVVVLGGGQNQFDGMPANDALTSASIKRLVEGVRLFRALPKAKLVLSGGSSTEEQPEALLAAQLATWFSIPDKSIVLEAKSINTADQAREMASIVHNQPFYLVTSAIHMPRSMALFEQQGLHPIAAPTDFTFFWNSGNLEKMIIPNSYNLSYFSIAMHEILGRLWASFQNS